MLRPLHVSLALAASAVLLAGCDDGTRAQSAASHARESSLAHDLELAQDSSLAKEAAGLDTHAVTESPGMLDSSTTVDSVTSGTSRGARNATNVSAGSTPSAEGYVGPSCASPARDDQQRCLLGYLAKSDALLDRYYQALILRLKAEAGATSSATEPSAVQRLRNAQRAWLAYRDEECRRRTHPREGPLWAPIRAECLAEYSALRARELDDALSKRKTLGPREKPAKPKRASARKSSRHTRTRER